MILLMCINIQQIEEFKMPLLSFLFFMRQLVDMQI